MKEEKGRKRMGIPAQDIEEAVDEILLKRARGEKLDRRELLILAYGYHAAGCKICSRWR